MTPEEMKALRFGDVIQLNSRWAAMVTGPSGKLYGTKLIHLASPVGQMAIGTPNEVITASDRWKLLRKESDVE